VNGLASLYRRLDLVQKSKWFHIAASALAALLVAGMVIAVAGIEPASTVNREGFQLPRFLLASNAAPYWTGALMLGWLLLIIWLDLGITYLLIVMGTSLAALPFLLTGHVDWALAVGGFGLLAFTFMVLIKALLVLYSQPNQVLAIAHTVIKESVRLRVSVAFIVLLLIILPLIPMLVESEQALRYRIQSFIGYSMGATFYLAALMTIFLSCATISFEIRDRQIWQLMTKPVSRFTYLIGKWLGVVSVNLALLVVTGVSIFVFVQHLRYQRAANIDDAERVETEVLVARVGSPVSLEPIDADAVRDLARGRIENDFTLRQQIENRERDEMEVMRELMTEIRKEAILQQRTIERGEMKQYVFEGLEGAREMGERGHDLFLRYRIHYGAEDTHVKNDITFLVFKDGQPAPYAFREEYVPTMSQYLKLPIDVVADDGTVTIGIANGVLQRDLTVDSSGLDYSINFDPEDLEMLYAVGGFEMNYTRAMVVTWVKLAFIAGVGIACATVLSFPVAVMMTLTVFLAAILGPFLSVSLGEFRVDSAWRVDKWVIKGIATMLVFLFEPFGQTNPSQKLIEGRLIPWWAVLRAIGLLGIAWTGVAIAVGYLGFKDRELAIYSGHG